MIGDISGDAGLRRAANDLSDIIKSPPEKEGPAKPEETAKPSESAGVLRRYIDAARQTVRDASDRFTRNSAILPPEAENEGFLTTAKLDSFIASHPDISKVQAIPSRSRIRPSSVNSLMRRSRNG